MIVNFNVKELLLSFLLASAFILFRAVFSFSDMKLNKTSDELIITNLYILESPLLPGEYISQDIYSPGFKLYNFGPLPDTLKDTKRMYTFTGIFFINPSLSNTLLSLYLGPCSYPYAVYLNGSEIVMRGNYNRIYEGTSYETLSIQLRNELLRYGDILNHLTIQAYPQGNFSPLEAPLVTTEKKSSRMAFMRNLFNVYFIEASFAVGILIGLYFIFLFFARRFIDRHYLYFALMCFFLSFSYFNNSFSYSSVNEVSLEKVSYFSFPMAALFITMFLREFTRLLKMKWVSFVLVLPASFSSLYILLLNTKSEIDLFFNNYLLNFIIIPLMLLSFILLIIAYIKKRLNKYLIILSAFILNILAGIHDIIYTINYQTPYCWLVPYSCLTLLISIFTVLAMEESSIYAESVKRTREVDRKNASMRAVFNKLEDVSRNLINSSTILKDNISKAALIIDESGVNNNVIYEKLNIQIREIENVTNMITERLEKDADKIPKAVISQTGVVEAINNTLNNMNNHIEKIHMLIIQTDNIARELSKIASNSKEIVQKSRVSIEKVSENSKFISEVLENIQEIVEESNFLSVNASIESSYAGVASEGFSILAGEIKNLANKSKEWLNMSQERLKLMTRSITESTKLSEQVADHLLKIIEKAADSADMIAGVSVHINEHKVEASAIREGTDMLLQETLSIRSMTEEDFAENENLKLTLFTLKKSFIDMTAMLSRHNESQNIIREAIGHIQDVLSDNLNTIDILKEALLMAGPEKLLKRIDLI